MRFSSFPDCITESKNSNVVVLSSCGGIGINYRARASARTHTQTPLFLCVRTISVTGSLLTASPSRVTLTLLCCFHLHTQLHHPPAETAAPPCNPESVPALPRMSFYGMVPSGESSKPCMSAHTGSSTGAIRPIPSRFRVLRTVSIDRLKPAYVPHINTEFASPPIISSSITTRSGRRVCFRHPGVASVSAGGGGDGRHSHLSSHIKITAM